MSAEGIAIAAGAVIAGELLTGGKLSRELGLFSGRVRSADVDALLAGFTLDPTGAGAPIGEAGQRGGNLDAAGNPDSFLDAAGIQERRLGDAFPGGEIPNRYLIPWLDSWRKLVRALRWPSPDGSPRLNDAGTTARTWEAYRIQGAGLGSFPPDSASNGWRLVVDAWEAAVAVEGVREDIDFAVRIDPGEVDRGNIEQTRSSIRTLALRLDTVLDPAGSVIDEAGQEFIDSFAESTETVGRTVGDVLAGTGELVGNVAAGAFEGLLTSKLALVALAGVGLWLVYREAT